MCSNREMRSAEEELEGMVDLLRFSGAFPLEKSVVMAMAMKMIDR